MQRHPLAAAALLAMSATLTGCGPVTGVMLAGNIINAAGYAAVDASLEARDEQGAAERQRGMAEHLAWVGAENGDPTAAYRLATLLTQRHDPSAVRWMCEAALEGHAGAQLQVGHWFNEDRRREDLWPFIDLTPDDRVAYLWYTSALDNGEQRAFIFRETLSRSPDSGSSAATLPGCGQQRWHAAPRDSNKREV